MVRHFPDGEQRKAEKQARKERREHQKLEREAQLAATAFVWDATAAKNLKGEALRDMLSGDAQFQPM